jgi:glycogen(starch) synthase
MRILLHSRFYPSIGGIETVAELLSREWQRRGAEVVIVSDVACPSWQRRDFGFPVYYRPAAIEWLRLLRWSELFVHMNLSLRALWPRLLVLRPLVVVNHCFYFSDRHGARDWRERLKLRLLAGAANIAVSDAVAEQIATPCVVIPNPVNPAFSAAKPVQRNRELVFVGRLVSDKGCDLLLQVLAQLRDRGLRPKLTIIGDGPERASLQRQAAALALTEQVEFTGWQSAERIAELLARHEILVIPSLVAESFGVSALEGAACGCVLLGADGGGLPEAIGAAGITFHRGDAADLLAKLEYLLRSPQDWPRYRAAAPAHLARHQPAEIATRYLEVFAQAVSAHAPLTSAAKPMSAANAAQ